MALKKDAKRVFLLAMTFGVSVVYAADSRMLMLSIQLPPQDVITAVQKDLFQQKTEGKIQKMGSLPPDKFAKKMIKGLMPSDLIPKTTRGIMALYAGYSTYSDKMGMITFPLRHDGKSVEVVATPSMDLEHLYKQTLSGVFISQKTMKSDGIPDEMAPQKFVYAQVDDAPAVPKVGGAPGAAAPAAGDAKQPVSAGGMLGSWKVERSALPSDAQIPTETVILLLNPKNLFVPQGKFMSMTKPHIVLPDMYLIGKKFNDEVLLNNQKNMRYFEEIVVQNGSVIQKDTNMEIHQSAVVND